MVLRLYDNDSWQSPTSVRVYNDSEWKAVSVGYVYDMGVWRVIFPDPIIPSVSIALGPITYSASVYVEFDLINADYIVVELYSGTTQSSLLQSQTIDTNHNITDRAYVSFSGLSGDTTYNIKVIAYSITENSTAFLTGSFTTAPSVTLTATAFEDLSGALVQWTTTRQSRWRVIIRRTSDQSEVYRSSLDLQTGTTSSINAYFSTLANTQYTVQLDLEFTGGGVATTYANFTTPNVVQPSITSLTSSSTCASITANWAGNNYVTAEISLYEANYDTGLDRFVFGQILVGPITYGTSTTSHTFTGLSSQQGYGLLLTLTSSTGQAITSTTYLGQEWIDFTEEPSVNAPTINSISWVPINLVGQTGYLYWTDGATNCSSITGYRLEIKKNLASSSSWAATTFNPSNGFFIVPEYDTAYNFRLFALSDSGESSPSNIYTSTSPSPPAPSISSFYSSSQTQTSVTLNWQSSNQTSWEIRNNATNELLASGSLSSATSTTISGLSTNTSYTFKLIIFNAASASTSATTTVSTLNYTRSSCSITSFTDTSRTSFTVNWSSTNQNYYRVRAYENGTVVYNSGIVNSTSRSVTATGLTAGISYSVELTVWSNDEYNNAGVSASQSTSSKSTTAPTFNGSLSGTNTLVFSWNANSGHSYWRVRIYKKSDLNTVVYGSGKVNGTASSWSKVVDRGATYRATLELWSSYDLQVSGPYWTGDIAVPN